ncbi:ATP-binding protein [Streptomyces mirabilis]|jgi:hypothetical protein|uniref:NB-ARC domain-containing protein n=1 Tax=Streptomyces mirabilis TaxID=68239 RepID=A0A1I2W960_9ACTN|nr:ATP-binding protein [Streptomyces mirabilis]SFG97905.1 hypothetical protein SAMN02787118_1362 [Streptomyces mirabilis]
MPELRAILRDLLDRSGLSYADLTRNALRNGEVLERGTLSDLFGDRCTISEQKLRILLRAIDEPETDSELWVDAWRRARGDAVVAGVKGYFQHLIATHTPLFAGRDEESRRILDFIAARGSGYVFVEALSGFGKTSLLANLVDRHRDFCYHFISQTYRRTGAGFDSTRATDVLDSLCEQLAPGRVRGIELRGLEEEFISLMNKPYRKQTVVVLDGIDELGRDEKLVGLLPRRLPPGLVVVLSARAKGTGNYLNDVGLSTADIDLHLNLPGLDATALAALLTIAGGAAASLARDQDFVASLHAMSKGDPFYLRFLVEDMARGALTADDVTKVPSGLEEYLDAQFEALKRSGHRPEHVQILSFLLAADALSRRDLIALVDGLNAFNFDEIIGEIHRFLLLHEGRYTFCHDRFRQYFRVKAGLE